MRHGKSGRQRTVGIHEEAQAALEQWLRARAQLRICARPVFCTILAHSHGRRLYPSYIRDTLTAKARKAGLSARVHPHAFRATLAVELARESVPLPAIRDVLGHANLATTDAYLRRVFPQDAIAAVIERHQPEPDPALERVKLVDAIDKLDAKTVRKLLKALE